MKQKMEKKYLKKKTGVSIFIFWLLFGFLGGTAIGGLIFQNSDKNAIKLTMVYSSEKSSWISESSGLFLKYWEEKRQIDPTLKPINLDFQPYGSGDSLISLLNEEIQPTIWSPASNIWVPLLNSKWSQITHDNTLLVPNFTRIIYSPVVIAVWEDFYKAHPFNGLNELHDLIKENPGLIKLAHTDPRASNSGFMATIMMVSGYLNMDPSKITLDNISNNNVINWMREIESAAIFYGKSTGFLGKYMRDQGPDALQVAILYENLVQDFCIPAQEKYGQKIKAIYPVEGSLFSDHPFCILNGDWVTPEQKMVAREYITFLQRDDMIAKAISTGFRPINNTILDIPYINEIYNQSFNEEHGVTFDSTIIKELLSPSDGTVIARIPDLWLLTRNKE
ncbi:MAG: substrate-binding domain-containing protein [Promethearchaeota archaeon]